MKKNFLLSLAFSLVWLFVSVCFAIGWGREASYFLSPVYVWWAIIGIALLPGFLMSMMFFPIFCTGREKSIPKPIRIPPSLCVLTMSRPILRVPFMRFSIKTMWAEFA